MHKDSNTRAITTKAAYVEIFLNDGSTLFGKIAVPIQGRLSDVLNDGRSFLPVEMDDGSFHGLSKKAIRRVTLPSSETAAYRGDDPYRILGVREGVSQEELKKAYYQRCTRMHPDRVRGLDLGADFEELATQNMVRINSAYAILSKIIANRTATANAA